MESVPTIVLAPDKFKGSLTAAEVVDSLATGIGQVRPDARVVRVPVADGGDGTVDAFVSAGWTRVLLRAPGPTGELLDTSYAVHGETAVIELAAVAGLAKLPGGRPDPLNASTFGLGVVIAHALDAGATRIVLGLGGSASTDGGAGMLTGLGAKVIGPDGRELPRGGASLLDAKRWDPRGLHPGLAAAQIIVASDVDNPLLGPSGAVTVYATQKGASRQDMALLEAALRNWALLTGREFAGRPGAGAAGGTGFAAMALLGAELRSGIEVVLELLDFTAVLESATLVVTGEGCLDEQTLHGKAPMGVAAAARAAGIPVVAVAGRSELTVAQIATAGFAVGHTLAELQPDPERSIAEAAALLEQLGARIAVEQLDGRSRG
ncbi:glycerate kinase [Nocardia cyriacigeorgica]|uniref:Glycerate kinase n=1 Tax=Nocardia cyriacigeorgica TaxID=135487 RepID=A0A6P1D740_9NOCA|nr:glycerate kinase [Nocardia cyriacigeorgica]NEW38582.1 glycerate kinase [Nocardia cyriacigeorgica]NEW45331.1 glycerate kinase [Nocardia cyriacigeorgica]NEW49607.1 glycerate kinase [Nocardia cyriacigeorgica]NEW57331.1 glycerate kinase [Nocardia cyriacigeorgica]